MAVMDGSENSAPGNTCQGSSVPEENKTLGDRKHCTSCDAPVVLWSLWPCEMHCWFAKQVVVESRAIGERGCLFERTVRGARQT